MSTNGLDITDDADMAESGGDKIVTMMDVLQEQQEFEEDANAVLGASDDKNCTYSLGYIKRQALYACLTCCSDAKEDPTKRAAVCLACSLSCHENHDLIELYTKRNFRCDCGNPKFNSHPCQFTPNKTDLNEDNQYNQNFSGLYCVCSRPYPDPESDVEDDMIQCIVCEDWLHSRHLDATVPANDQYAEMICKSCMENNKFLYDYSCYAVNLNEYVDVTTDDISKIDISITAVNGHDCTLIEKDISNSDILGASNEASEQSNDIGITITEVKSNSDCKTTIKVDGVIATQSNNIESSNLELDKDNVENNNWNNENKTNPTIELVNKQKMDYKELQTAVCVTDNKLNSNTNDDENKIKESEIDTSEVTHLVGRTEETSVLNSEQNVIIDDESKEILDNINDLISNGENTTENVENKNESMDEDAKITESKLLNEEDLLKYDDAMDENAESKNNEHLNESETVGDNTEAKLLNENDNVIKEGDKVMDNNDESSLLNQNDELLKEGETVVGNTEAKLLNENEKTESDEVMDDNDESSLLNQNDEPSKESETVGDNTEATFLNKNKEGDEIMDDNDESSFLNEKDEHLKESETVGDNSEAKLLNENDKVIKEGDKVMDNNDKSTLLNQNVELLKEGEAMHDNTESKLNENNELLKEDDKTNEPINESNETKLLVGDDTQLDNDLKLHNKTDLPNDNDTMESLESKEPELLSKNNEMLLGENDIGTINSNDNAEVANKMELQNEILKENTDIDVLNENNDTGTPMNKSITESKEPETLSEKMEIELLNENYTVATNADEESEHTKEIVTSNELETGSSNEHKRKLSIENFEEPLNHKKAKLDKDSCKRPTSGNFAVTGATFWPSNFRQKLCTCNDCLKMYKDLSVLYLIDPEDTVTAYETLGKEKADGTASQYEKGLEALSSLDRMQQINALTEYNNMRDKLIDFLKNFKDRKEIVKEEDIKGFFAGMKPTKDGSGVYFCR